MPDPAPNHPISTIGSQTLHEPRQLAFDELDRVSVETIHLGIDEFFPEAFADELARQEAYNKHLFRPNTYLHKWWARRCGTTFRAILKQFVPDPTRRDYYAPGGLEGKVVLDPMMGGGTTLHEAIRLGASVIGVDIDPIPVMQVRAALSPVDLADLQRAFENLYAALYAEIGTLFKTECPLCGQTVDMQYTLYGLRKTCDCGEIVQIDQYELRHESDRTLRIQPDTWEITDSKTPFVLMPTLDKYPRLPLRTKNDLICPICGEKYRELLDVPFYARYVPFAIVGECPQHGLFFRSQGPADSARLEAANARRATLEGFRPLESFAVQNGPKSRDLVRHGIHSYLDVFSSRQLLYLDAAIRYLTHNRSHMTEAIYLNLALLVSTSLEFNAMLCGYKGWFERRPGAIRHVFSLHAYSLPYTALENNPVNRETSSGNLRRLFNDRLVRGRTWAAMPVERRITSDGKPQLVQIRGEWDGGVEVFNQADLTVQHQSFWLIHHDARELPLDDHSVDFIVTDPPYYDSVQYSDLAAFFRVWLAQLLPGAMDWDYNVTHSAVATKSIEGDTDFMRVLAGIFQECARVLKPETGRLVFTFHHWDPNAWAELTLALRAAGFRLLNRYVVSSENPISVHINNLNSIKHDTILVLALKDQATHWLPVAEISTEDSATFCRQCGAALGMFLESTLPPEEIRIAWRNLIQKGGNHGKPSG